MPTGLAEAHNAVSLPSNLEFWVHDGLLLLDDASWRIRISNEYSSSSSILRPVNNSHRLLLRVPPRLPEMAHLHEACNTWKHAHHQRVRLYDVFRDVPLRPQPPAHDMPPSRAFRSVRTDGLWGSVSYLLCSHSLDTSFVVSRCSPLRRDVAGATCCPTIWAALARHLARSNNDSSAPDRLPHEAATKGGHQGLQHHHHHHHLYPPLARTAADLATAVMPSRRSRVWGALRGGIPGK